MFRGRMFRAA